MKKFLSILLAAMMVLAMTAAYADFTITYPTTGVKNNHTYEIYQIFEGDISTNEDGDPVLSNVVWGKNAASSYEPGEAVDEGILDTLKGTTGSDQEKLDAIKVYVDLTSEAFKTLTAADGSVAVPAGYYLIKDADGTQDDQHDAYTTYIVQVLNPLTISPKAVYPSVEKEVLDETDDAETGHDEGWGESADHAINESFDFRLTATLPDSENYDDYTEYKVTFVDTMSSGITFEQIDSVTVDGVTVNAQELNEDGTVKTAGYVCTATNGQAGGEWKLEIANVKAFDGVDLTDGADIVVVYSAHLNENAQVDNASNTSTTNKNTVKLKYSNNPNGEGEGQTPEDHVFLFTYEVKNTKYANQEATGNEFAGAGFTLYDADGAAVKLIDKGNGTYVVADQTIELEDADNDGKYTNKDQDPKDETVYVYEMFSADGEQKGQFNIKGLDAGSYTLKETTTPPGYNTLEDYHVVISATHLENAAKDNAEMTLNGSSTMNNKHTNKSGATLPSTGGIGTTLFYLIGGLMAAGSALTLVIRRRADADEE